MLKFNKLLWLNRKTRITADNMNRIEDGIEASINEINDINNRGYIAEDSLSGKLVDKIENDTTVQEAINSTVDASITWNQLK